MRIDSTFLRSKVARRIFALFVASALIPIGTLALLSFDQVTGQLVENGYKQLHRDSKSIAMTIFERLSIAESELKLLGRQKGAQAESFVELIHLASNRDIRRQPTIAARASRIATGIRRFPAETSA
jgi:hypothetical protein